MSFLAKIKKFLNVEEISFVQDEMSLQDELAPILRKKAVHHLATAPSVVAKSFRGEYLRSGMGDYGDFLQTQSKTGTWGTYLEATALGEAIGCHVVVTPVKSGVEQKPICLYRADDNNAPTIHLYNSDNTHWYVNHKTKGQGNCLFNAFAQALQKLVKPELRFVPEISAISKTSGIVQQHFLNATVKESKNIIEHQIAIAAAIRQHPTPKELEADFFAEKARISALPAKVQQQIADDHKFALALAREEMGYAAKNVFYRNIATENATSSHRVKQA